MRLPADGVGVGGADSNMIQSLRHGDAHTGTREGADVTGRVSGQAGTSAEKQRSAGNARAHLALYGWRPRLLMLSGELRGSNRHRASLAALSQNSCSTPGGGANWAL